MKQIFEILLGIRFIMFIMRFLSKNGDKALFLLSQYNYNDHNIKDDLVDIDPVKALDKIHQKHSNRLVIAQLNINSLRNKFASLSTMIKDYVDLLLISETKIDSSFPTAQFQIEGYTIHKFIDVTEMKMEVVYYFM